MKRITVNNWDFWKWKHITYIIHQVYHIHLTNKQVKEFTYTYTLSKNRNNITSSYEGQSMHKYFTRNSIMKIELNVNSATRTLDSNILTTFIFVKVSYIFYQFSNTFYCFLSHKLLLHCHKVNEFEVITHHMPWDATIDITYLRRESNTYKVNAWMLLWWLRIYSKVNEFIL